MSRRGKVTQVENGTWHFVVDVAAEGAPRKQQRRRGFPTKTAATKELNRILSSVDTKTFVAPDRITVSEYLDGWLDGLATQGRAPATIASYRRQIRLHVAPTLGAAKLQALTPTDLDRLYARLLAGGRVDGKGGLSPRSVRYVHSIVGRALKDAGRKGLLLHNVARAADPPSAKSARSPEMKWWTPTELNAFLGWLTARRDGLLPLVRLAVMTGMRRGEVCGVLWDAVDLDNAKIHVRRQLSSIDGKLVFAEHPKSDHGRRTISLDPETVAVLRAHRASQAALRLAVGPGWKDEGLVFTGPDGASVDPDSIGKVFGRRVARAAVPAIRFHDLRHTHCAHLIAANVNVKAVSKRMGHASVAFTLDRYGHLLPDADEHAAEAVAALLDAAVTNP